MSMDDYKPDETRTYSIPSENAPSRLAMSNEHDNLPQHQDPDTPQWVWRPVVPYNDEDGGDAIMTIDEFIAAVAVGAYTDDDGYGECAVDGYVSNARIYASDLSRPSWTTHVCWYNR